MHSTIKSLLHVNEVAHQIVVDVEVEMWAHAVVQPLPRPHLKADVRSVSLNVIRERDAQRMSSNVVAEDKAIGAVQMIHALLL
jgi:hypothetical protein